MDHDGHSVVIEQPDGAMHDTPFRVARNGGAGRVRSNAEISKSSSAPVRSGKFKKRRVAPPKKKKIVLPIKWTRIHRYKSIHTGIFRGFSAFFRKIYLNFPQTLQCT